ncbi:alcohol dehydrogenase catalytic domain-containing protein [Pseudonocardia xishanensis]|uniref:Zn-dependent alcohol dehydrogenase n=1 Tax=Pseudonocardia xishanensis TaxID=630995 RepID=A0ABP8RJA5_9PSEU
MGTSGTAAVLRHPRERLLLEEVEIADPREDEVLVAIAASGVCASDVHLADGTLEIPGLGGYPLPIVPGHEAAGVVEQVGSAVRTVQPGDHVIINIYPGCGRCRPCVLGRAAECSEVRPGALPGGGSRLTSNGATVHQMSSCSSFAERTVVPQRGCVKIPPEMPLDRACLIGCGVATGFAAVFHVADVRPGDSVLVLGVGGVGLNVVQSAVLAGARTVVAVDLGATRLDKAKEFGATHVLDASSATWTTAVREIVAGGVDHGFEVVSTPTTVRQVYDATRDGGMVTVVGLAPPGSTVALPTVPSKTFTRGGLRWARPASDFRALVDLYLAGRFKLDELVTDERPMREVNEVMDSMRRGLPGRTILTNEEVLLNSRARGG